MRIDRREFVSIVGISVLSGCSGPSNPSTGGEENHRSWRMFNGNAKNTGNATKQTVSKSPSIGWESGELPDPTTSPVIADSTLILCTQEGAIAYALDDGSQEWVTSLEFKPGGTPAIHGNTVFVTEDDRFGNSRNARVHALSLDTGDRIWTQPINANAVLSPSVSESGVFVRTNTSLVSLARSSGDIQWATPNSGRFGDFYYDITADISPAVLDDSVVFPSGDGLVSVAVDSGEELWQRSAQKVRAAPSTDGEYIYYSDVAKGIRAISVSSGEMEWTYDAAGSWTTPAVADGLVVATAEDKLVALDSRSGEERWVSESLRGDIYTSPVITDEQVVAGSIDTSAAAVSVETGNVRWRVGRGTRRSPAISGGNVFATGRYDGNADRGKRAVVAVE